MSGFGLVFGNDAVIVEVGGQGGQTDGGEPTGEGQQDDEEQTIMVAGVVVDVARPAMEEDVEAEDEEAE